VLVLHLLGLHLVLASMLNKGQWLLLCLLSVGDRLLVSGAEVYHFIVGASHPLLGLYEPCLSHGSPLRLLRLVSQCAPLTAEELRLRPAPVEYRLCGGPRQDHRKGEELAFTQLDVPRQLG
jgi:hypothetical protein